jgi:hypothetical protein
MIIDNSSPNYRMNTDFFTKDELENVISYLNSRTEAQWEHEFNTNYAKEEDVSESVWMSMKGWKGMSIDILSEEKFEETREKAKKDIEDRFKTKVKVEQCLLNRWRVGRDQLPHIDYFLDDEDNDQKVIEQYESGSPEFFENFKENFKTKNYSTLIYLNDDFVGGELYFPQYSDLTIKPIENLSICFKGDTKHLHGVKMVEEGIRYTISIFWTEQ